MALWGTTMLIRANITIRIESDEPTQPEPSSQLDPWIAKIQGLTDQQVRHVAVVLDVLEETDAMRGLFGLLPDLLRPGRALTKAYWRSRPEFLRRAYQLATVRDVLEGRVSEPETLAQYVARHWPANDNGDGVVTAEVDDVELDDLVATGKLEIVPDGESERDGEPES